MTRKTSARACRAGASAQARAARRPSRVRARGACGRTARGRCSSARTPSPPPVSLLRPRAAPEWPRVPAGTARALPPRLLLLPLRERSSAAAAEVAAAAGARPPALRSPPFPHAPASTPDRARSPEHKTMSSR